jgi:DNA-directed RNA polymerase subunit RPC12/RpoP
MTRSKRRVAMPLLDADLQWVNVTVSCNNCGDSLVGYQVRELIEVQPEFVCPMCDSPTGQRTTVGTQ